MKTRFDKEPVVTDEMLSAAGQQHARALVAGLKDESMSMAWRSELNLKLLAEADKRNRARRTRKFLTWGSSLGFAAVASSFAFLLFQPIAPSSSASTDGSKLAREFVQAHNELTVLASVSGTGVDQRETELGLETGYSYEDML